MMIFIEHMIKNIEKNIDVIGLNFIIVLMMS